jgi:hypothetical protein
MIEGALIVAGVMVRVLLLGSFSTNPGTTIY